MNRSLVILCLIAFITFIISCNSGVKIDSVEDIKILSSKAEDRLWMNSLKSDYSQESLEELENWFASLDKDSQKKFSPMVGAYFGECMIKKYGGEWELLDGYWAVKFKEDSYAFPFSKIEKFIIHGQEDSFYSMYLMVDRVINE